MKFAGLLRDLLLRFDGNGSGTGVSQPPRFAVPVPPPSPSVPVPPVARAAAAPPAPKPAVVPAAAPVATPAIPAAPPAPRPVQAESATHLELPLEPVLQTLPLELRSKMKAGNVDLSRASISIALKKILPQLAQGIVKITFGELRRAAPSLFEVRDEYDSLPIVLPLNNVLERLGARLPARNPVQKIVEVPADIAGPFEGRGQGVSISTTPAKRPSPLPVQTTAEPPSAVPSAPPSPPAIPQLLFTPRPNVPAPAAAPVSHNGNGTNGAMSNGRLSKPVVPAVPALPVAPPRPSAPAPQSVSLPPLSAGMAISLPLSALSEKWPEALRSEIAQQSLKDAQVALPAELVEPALKRGRVTFTWGKLRSWIKPAPPAASAHDALELELPLKVIVPYFLGRQNLSTRMTQPQQTLSVSAEIPNLFFGFPQPLSPAETPGTPSPVALPETPSPDENRLAPKPAVSSRPLANFNSYTETRLDNSHAKTRPEEAKPKPSAVSGTGSAVSDATPKDVISRAMALDGVAGAVVALPDGLPVASQVPSGFNADTLAAFLPQIFDRVNQSAKELRMGTLGNLNFTVGAVPWEIFRVNGVYFAAFGRVGGHLPTVQLNALASELQHKKQ